MAWPTSPAPHVAEMELNNVSPAVVFETPSVPVERIEAEVPPLVLAPVARTIQVVMSESRLLSDKPASHEVHEVGRLRLGEGCQAIRELEAIARQHRLVIVRRDLTADDP